MKKQRLLNLPAFIILGVLALTVSSWISIPLNPVPITLQTVVVLLLGILFGGRLGAGIVLVWLILAALGLPVLSDGKSGIGALTGPTAGYLWSFLPAAYLAGTLPSSRQFGAVMTRFSGAIGLHVLILSAGMVWLSLSAGINTAFYSGFLPFLFGGFIKSLIVAAVPAFLPKRLDLRY